MKFIKVTRRNWAGITAILLWSTILTVCGFYGLATDNIMALVGGVGGLLLILNILLHQKIDKVEKRLDNPPQ